MKCKKLKYFFILLSIFGFQPLWAEFPDLARLANNIASPIKIASSGLILICYLIGFIFLFLTVAYYNQYNKNPIFMPLRRVIMTFIMGLIFIFFAWSNNDSSILNKAPKPISPRALKEYNKDKEKNKKNEGHWSQKI